MEQWTDIQLVLTWLAGIGSPLVVMYLLSIVAENWPKWHTLPHPVKLFAPAILSILISVGANVLLGYTAFLEQVQPWFQIVMTSILAYISSQKAYMSTKATGYGVKNRLE